MAYADGYALEHRFVLYEAGIELPRGVHVHHRNGDKTDNRIENLEVKWPRDHALDHIRDGGGYVTNQFGRHPLVVEKTCATCGESFRPWKLDGRYCSRVCSNRRER